MWSWVWGSTGEHCGNNPRSHSSVCRARAQGNSRRNTAQALGVFWVTWAPAGDSPQPRAGRTRGLCLSPAGWSWFPTELTPLLWQGAAVMGALCSGTHLPSQEPNFPLLFLFLLPVPSWVGWFCFYGFTFTKPLLQSSHQVAINPEITLLLNTNYFVFLKARALKASSQKKKIFVGSTEASPGCLTPISLFGELVMCFPLDART